MKNTQSIVEAVADVGEALDILYALERKFPMRISVVTRTDVEDEFRSILECEGIEPRDMTEDEWQRFAGEWFWRKGHSEVMYDGVIDAVRSDLRYTEIVPETTPI